MPSINNYGFFINEGVPGGHLLGKIGDDGKVIYGGVEGIFKDLEIPKDVVADFTEGKITEKIISDGNIKYTIMKVD